MKKALTYKNACCDKIYVGLRWLVFTAVSVFEKFIMGGCYASVVSYLYDQNDRYIFALVTIEEHTVFFKQHTLHKHLVENYVADQFLWTHQVQ